MTRLEVMGLELSVEVELARQPIVIGLDRLRHGDGVKGFVGRLLPVQRLWIHAALLP